MKRIALLMIGVIATLSLLWVGTAQALNVRTGDTPIIMKDETIDGTLYAAGRDISVEGTVKGDLICAGQIVRVVGTVEGDVLCAGADVVVRGTVGGDVRAAGQTVTIEGTVASSATIAGQTIILESAATIARDVTLLGQDINVKGKIARDATVRSENFTVAGTIGRDLDVTAEQVNLVGKATVARNFTYTSRADARVESGAQVLGATDHKIPTSDESSQLMSPADYLTTVVFSLSSFIVLGFAMLLVAPRLLTAGSSAMSTSLPATIGYGLVGVIVPPFLAILLCTTIIGIPLAVIVLLGWIISLMTAVVFAGLAVGRLVLARTKYAGAWQHFVATLLGLAIIFLLALLPFVGGFIMFAAVVWGVGGLWYVVLKQFRGQTLAPASPSPQKQPVKKGGKHE